MKIKVCGMKYHQNILDVAKLQPEYMGFIFYNKSKRNFSDKIPTLPLHIKKTGVFVNKDITEVAMLIKKHNFQAVQLHGDESADYCKELKNAIQDKIEIIKVFSVGETFDFETTEKYEAICDYFLFDTKGKEKGGNGITFNWEILENYKGTKPYFLSGGIGLNQIKDLDNFRKMSYAKNCYAIDVNSRFEIEPGLKNIDELKAFQQELIKA